MHAYSLWWKLLGGNNRKDPSSQAKAKTKTRHGKKTKPKKQADCGRRTTAAPPSSAPGTGGQEHGPRDLPDAAVLDAGGDGVVRTLLKAVSIRRLKAMTSRSRVCGNPKYKVNNQNLEKFEQLLSKIPEVLFSDESYVTRYTVWRAVEQGGDSLNNKCCFIVVISCCLSLRPLLSRHRSKLGEKLKGTASLTSLPERHEEAKCTPLPAPTPGTPPLPERPVPDISPSTTMGSSVTAEYELFCKAFHSEAKELLPEEQQQKVCGNPMRQMLQSASEAASKGLQLQRVTSAFGAADSPRDTRTIDETYAPTAMAPGVLPSRTFIGRSPGAQTLQMSLYCKPSTALSSFFATPSNFDEEAIVPDMVAALAGAQSAPDSVTELSAPMPPQPERVPSREELVQELRQDQPHQQQQDQQDNQQPQDQEKPGSRHSRPQRQSRRWSENPVGAPVFMAKKFAEKQSKPTEPTGAATSGPRRKSSASLFKALKPKLPFSSPKIRSKQSTPPAKQPPKSAVGGNDSPQPSTSSSTPKEQSPRQGVRLKKVKR
ncbi:uncharacterized protein LOC144101468 [Amblyomma americanum]